MEWVELRESDFLRESRHAKEVMISYDIVNEEIAILYRFGEEKGYEYRAFLPKEDLLRFCRGVLSWNG